MGEMRLSKIASKAELELRFTRIEGAIDWNAMVGKPREELKNSVEKIESKSMGGFKEKISGFHCR